MKVKKMNYILSRFFYSVGLVMLLCVWALNPATSEFKDYVALLHGSSFWNIVAIVALFIVCLDMFLNSKFINAVDTILIEMKKLYASRKTRESL